MRRTLAALCVLACAVAAPTLVTPVRAAGVRFAEKDVTFPSGEPGITLAGTIAAPAEVKPRASIILITGAGPQDRDETIFGHKPFKTIADYLASNGFLVLRYDDRGVGKSNGDPGAPTLALADDADGALAFLTARGPDLGPIGFLGHSEGGTIGALIAQARPEVKFLVMMATPALPGLEVVRQQAAEQMRANGRAENDIKKNDALLLRMAAAAVKQNATKETIRAAVEQVRAEIGEQPAWADAQVAFFSAPWTQQFLLLDPRPALTALRIPVLALYGEKDRQVPAGANQAAAVAALKGDTLARVSVAKGVNHLFQTAETGLPVEYAGLTEDIAPHILTAIGDWLGQSLGR